MTPKSWTVALVMALVIVQSAKAQTLTELYPFNSSGTLSDGGYSEAGVVRDAAGNLYGTTFFGGTGTGCDIFYDGCGTVFRLDSSGTETVLHSFGGTQDGWNPTGSLLLDSAGNLYGTTPYGGAHGDGVVFKVSAAGEETILHSFAGGEDGANPFAGLESDGVGNLYGVTQYGGSGCGGHGCGTVFRVETNGQETILYRFTGGEDGASPLGSLVLDPAGNIYATAWLGGVDRFGTLLKIDSGGNATVLHSFGGGTDGANPIGGLALDAAGNLYGTTSAGGPDGFGTVFMMDPAGNESVVYSFTGANDGAYPYSNLSLDAAMNLYGTASQSGAYGSGTVFELSGGAFTILYGFSAPNSSGENADGQAPMAGVALDAAGNLYGTTVQAGTYGWGSAFEIQPSSQAPRNEGREAVTDATAVLNAAPRNVPTIAPICKPTITAPIVVASSHQRFEAGSKAEPPLTDGFGWPDGPVAALKTATGYLFFSIDEGFHKRQLWQGVLEGNNNYGSVVRTEGTLDNPLGSAPPVDVVITRNPEPQVNPHNCDPTKNLDAGCYTYIGGGPVYVVPQGQVGAGNWLLVYHAEYDAPAYFLLGLAISSDKGVHWTDIGEIIRFNTPFSYEGSPAPFAIGDPPLVISPQGNYFYVYFQDWLLDGTATMASVARAPIASVLQAAFGGTVHAAAPFEKYYEGAWNQPGIGGGSTDLLPNARYGGGVNVAYNSYLNRYMMFNSDSQNFSYAESPDGLQWTNTVFLGMLGQYPNVAAYAMPIGTGENPAILGKEFYVYYTQFRGPWPGGQSVKRFTLSCEAAAEPLARPR